MKREQIQIVVLLALSAILLGANIGGYSLWAPDEPRFGQIAREMLQSGDFLVPRINGEPYREKPPLVFWLAAAVSWPFGDVSETTARVPSVCLGVLTVAMAYWLGRRLYGHETGIWSGAVLVTCALFFREARSIRTDIVLAACTTAFLCAHLAWADTRRLPWLVGMYAALAAGLLAKGPPMFVFPVLYLVAYYWRRWETARGLHPVIGMAVAVGIVLAWYIPARMAVAGVADNHATAGVGQEAYRQIIGRLFSGSTGHARPPWYYVINVPVSLLPWTLLLPWTFAWVWRHRQGDSARVLLSWIVPAFVFFSVSAGKREMYLLPAYPAMAIFVARSTLDLVEGDHAVWRRRTAYVWAFVLFALGAAAFGLLATQYRDLWRPGLGVFGIVALACCLQMVRDVRGATGCCMCAPIMLHRRIFVHFCILGILTAFIVFPVIDSRKGVSGICTPVRQLAESGAAFRMYTAGFTSEEYIFYSKHLRKEVLNSPYELPELAGDARTGLEKQQERLRGVVEKALERTPMVNPLLPTDAERAAVTNAIAGAIQGTAKDAVLAAAYQRASDQAFADVAAEFGGGDPAFMYIELHDWKRLVLDMPNRAGCRVLQVSPIGSRTIMLVANAAAAALVP